jgi:hypothetical protein
MRVTHTKLTSLALFCLFGRGKFLAVLLFFWASALQAADRYWVGGSGTWDAANTANWSASAGGPGGASVPTAADNVFFAPPLAGAAVVTVAGAVNCANLQWSLAGGTLAGPAGASLNVAGGTFSLASGMTWTYAGDVVFGSGVGTLTTGGVAMTGNLAFNAAGGWTIVGNLVNTGSVTGAAGANLTFQGLNNQLGGAYNVPGTTTLEPSTTTVFSGNFSRAFGRVVLRTVATLTMQTPATSSDAFGDIFLTDRATLRFSGRAANPTTVSGRVTMARSDCSNANNAIINSANGSLTQVNFATAHDWYAINQAQLQNTNTNSVTHWTGSATGSTGFVNNLSVPVPNLYWTGAAGAGNTNWSDCRNWAASSGGAVAGTANVGIPSRNTNALFDNNSVAVSNAVTINAPSTCRNFNTTALGSAMQLAATANELEIYGDLALSPSFDPSPFIGQASFLANGPQTIAMAGRAFARMRFGDPVVGSTNGNWVVQDNLNAVSNITLVAGTLNTNGNPVNTAVLSANPTGVDVARALVLSNSTVRITGSGANPVLDLRSVANLLTFNNPAATIDFTANASLVAEAGAWAKILPNITFSNLVAGTVNINTSTAPERITFGNVAVPNNAAGAGATVLNINGTAPKTFGAISLAQNVHATITGTTNNAPGSNNIINGAVTLAGNNEVNFAYSFTLNALLALNGPASQVRFGNAAGDNSTPTNHTFVGPVQLNGGGHLLFFDQLGNNTFQGTVTATGIANRLSLRNTGNNNFTQPVNTGADGIWQFNSCPSCLTTISNTFLAAGSCTTVAQLQSANLPVAGVARVDFAAGPYNLSFVDVANLNNAIAPPVNVSIGGSVTNSVGFAAIPGNPRTLYWVNGTGNWNSPSQWSASSGGPGGECIPRDIDNVIFDNNSSAAAFDVNITTLAACANLEWRNTDPARTPTLRSGAGTPGLRVTGNFLVLDNNALANNVNTTFAPNLNFGDPVGVAPILARTLRFADETFGPVDFNGVGVIWTIDNASAPLTVAGALGLASGTLNTNSVAVSVGTLNASSGNPRGLNLGNTALTIANGGAALNLGGPGFSFPTPGPSARIDFLSPLDFTVELPNILHELPRINLLAPGGAPAVVNVNTGPGNNRVTFREITIANDRQLLALNFNGATVPKTFSQGLGFSTNLANLNNSLLVVAPSAPGQENIYNGVVDLGNVAVANSLSSAEFRGSNTFNAPFNVRSSPGAGVRFTQNGANTFANTLTIAPGTVISFQNANGQNLYQDLNLGGLSTFEFSGGGGASSRVQGNVLFTGADCQRSVNLRGVIGIATVMFDNPATWTAVRVQFLHFQGATITINGVENLGSNSGTVLFSIAPRTLYWVGGTVGKTPSSFNWSDPNNWRTASGSVAGPAACPPTSLDDVIFDNSSFSAGPAANEVILNTEGLGANAAQPVCRNMVWLNTITNTPRFKRSNANSLGIYGSLGLQPPALMQTTGYATASENLTNLTFVFNAATMGHTIATRGHVLGAAVFNNVGEWRLQDPLVAASLLQIWGGVVSTYNLPITGATVFQPVATQNLNINGGTFDLGRSLVTISGGNADFNGGSILSIDDNTCGTLADNAGRFVFSSTTNIVVNVGAILLNFPDFHLPNLTAGNAFTLNSQGGNRLTFRDIFVDQSGVGFNILGPAPKTFGRLSFQNNVNATFSGIDLPVASWSSPTTPVNINIFECEVSFGTGTRALFGNSNRLVGQVNLGSTAAGANAVRFAGSNVFNQSFAVAGSPGSVGFGVDNTHVNRFQGAFALNGAPNTLNVTGSLGTGPSGAIFENTFLVNSTQANQTSANFAASVEFRDQVSWGSFAGGVNTTPINFEGWVDMYDGNGDGFGAPAGRLFLIAPDSRFVFGSDLVATGATPPNAATGQRSDFRNLEIGLNSSAQFNGLSTYDNLTMRDFAAIEFANANNASPTQANTNHIREYWNTDINGDQTCAQGAIRISSNRFGVQAHLRVDRNHDADDNTNAPARQRRLRNALVRDLNKVGQVAGDPYLGGVPVTRVQVYPGDIANVANNTEYVYVSRTPTVVFSTSGAGIDFNPVESLPAPPRQVYYWVRSNNQRTGGVNHASGGWGDLGNDNHWAQNNPNGLPSGCIPTAYDSVVFYNFGADAANVTGLTVVNLNRFNITVGGVGMTPTNKQFRFTGADDVNFRIFGAHYVDPAVPPANLDNQFIGTVEYTGYNASNRVGGAGGAVKELRTGDRFRFAGPVFFNSNLDRWVLRDNFDINGGTRGDLTLAYGILDAGDADGAGATPFTISLEGDWWIQARTTVNTTSALRRPLFVPRRSTVRFDGNGHRQTIRLDDQTKATPVVTDGLATATDCVECTQYVVGAQAFPSTAATDPATSNRAYGANPYPRDSNDPLVAANESDIISCSRSPFYNLEIAKPYNPTNANTEVQLRNGIAIYNDLRITSGQLDDNGQQIRGNYFNPINPSGGSLFLANNTRLVVGLGNNNTVFPTCFRTERITLSGNGEVYTPDDPAGNYVPVDPTGFFGRGGNNPSIVQYRADNLQIVSGPITRASVFPPASTQAISVGPATYGSLALFTQNNDQNYKDLAASAGGITINGSLFHHSGIFRDMGWQIRGNGFANLNGGAAQSPTNNKISMNNTPARATLYLGTGNHLFSVASIAPSGQVTYITPPGVTPPTTSLNQATSFPTFTPVGDFSPTSPANGGKMQMGESVVIYAAGCGEVNLYPSGSATVTVNTSAPTNLQPVQEVLAGFTYSRLQFIKSDLRTPSNIILKRVVNPTVVPTGVVPPYSLVVRDLFEIQPNVNLFDNGTQITATTTRLVFAIVGTNSQLTLGNDVLGTRFPPHFSRSSTVLDPTSTVMYLAGHLAPSLNVAGARQFVSSEPDYANLEVRDISPVTNPLTRKELTPAPPFTMRGNLLVGQHNLLADTRNQLTTTGSGRTFTLEDGNVGNTQGETHLELGVATVGGTATRLPTSFANLIISDSTTVIYNDANEQPVGFTGQNASFWNVFFRGDGTTVPSALPDPLGTNTKRSLGTIQVRNVGIVRRNVSLYDNGFQITGNPNASANPLFIMSAGANLMLGNATATAFPTQYTRPRIALDRLSTVYYQAQAAQDVSNQPSYGSLVARQFDNSAVGLIDKTVQGPQADVPVRGQLRIEAFNHLIDNGSQVLGNATDSLVMVHTGRLTLGTPTVATLFPTTFRTEFINLDAWTPGNPTLPRPKTAQNTVAYNANSPAQVVAGPVAGAGPGAGGTSPSAYGNVELRATAPVTKALVADINVRGSMIVGDNNTLDAAPNNYRINLGGDWRIENVGAFNARAGLVTLDGTDNEQLVRSNNQPFFDAELAKLGAIGLGTAVATLDFPLRIANQGIFNRGYFASAIGREVVFAQGATLAGSSPAHFSGAYSGAGPIPPPLALANGPSDTSHVAGPVLKEGNVPFFFPIGNGRRYAPLGLNQLANPASAFRAAYYGFDPTTVGANVAIREQPPLNNVSNLEFWTLDRKAGADQPYVTLSWESVRSGNINFPATTQVTQWYDRPDTRWWARGTSRYLDNVLRGAVMSGVVATNIDNPADVQFQNPFTLATESDFTLLPIQLLAFDARPDPAARQVLLTWATASEVNNAYFTVERSPDGRNFQPILQVPGAGNSRTRLDYRTIDGQPLAGVSYYRLKQTDTDGTFTYSKIVAVFMDDDALANDGFVLYPNPSTGLEVNLRLTNREIRAGRVVVFDVTGRQLASEPFERGAAEATIRLQFAQRLAAGTYVLRLVGNNGAVYQRKMVVN